MRVTAGKLVAHVSANEYLMKKPIAFIALSAALGTVQAQNESAVSATTLQPEVEQFSSMELLETWGYLLSERFNLGGLEVTDAEVEAIARGMKAYVNREKPPTDLSKSINPMQNYFVEREEMVRKQQLRRNRAEEEEYFDGLFGRPDYQSLGSGLYFQIIEPGSDVKPGDKDMVRCHYRGMLLDGTEFDSSYSRNEPSEFALNSVIPGWGQGLPLIGEGGKIKLFVPSKLGYGDEGTPGIPPASALVFEIELIKVLGPAPVGGPPLPPQQQ